jgi:dTDP-4-amino-4,6-dideoxygalactose transaminase
MGAYSFHETKNIISGEGGALLINDPRFAERAEIVREKGTNRSQFFRGQVDKYTWCDIGSSFLPGDLTGAFLWAQMEEAEKITQRRLDIWDAYHEALTPLEAAGKIGLPSLPEGSQHNAHMFYVVFLDLETRTRAIAYLKAEEINAVFHYVPLHDSSMGISRGRTIGNMTVTRLAADRLLRLPLWLGVETQQQRVVDALTRFVTHQ